MNEGDFKLTKGFKSYISKPEVTDLAPNYLVPGSKNVLIDYANRIISRNGYTLYNQARTAGATGIKSGYGWTTSTSSFFDLRVYGGKIEFDYASTYNSLLTGLKTSNVMFEKIWDSTELLDVLIMVTGDTQYYKWSGGATKVTSSTSTAVKKQGVLTAQTNIAFVAGTTGTVAATITDVGNRFVTEGFAAGDTLYVTGSVSNNKNFTIGSVTAGTITLIMSDVLVTEAAGASVTIHNGSPTWANSRFLTANKTVGNPTITIASPAVVTMASHGLTAGSQIVFTTSGALPTGITAGSVYYVISTGLTSGAFQFSATLNGAAVNTSGGQSGTHTLTTYIRKISYLGVEYAYTGGESTDTLTGLVGFPSVTAGDKVWQTVITIPNPSGISSAYKSDYVGVQFNQLILGSASSQVIFGSSTSDYTNFTLTTPRLPNGPFQVTIDGYCTGLIPRDNSDATNPSLTVGSGKDSFFKFVFIMSQDNTSEIVRVAKLKTATGAGIISRNAIASIKNAIAYISNEPSFELLGNVENTEGTQNTPISDIIKNDFDAYNFTGCDIKYWKRAVYIALPAEGIFLIYDLQRNLWQPPQEAPIGKWTIINGWLYGHSSVVNETYKMFDGTNDNGIFINQVARFAYNNGGRRDRIKNMSEYWTDGYITPNGVLNMTQYLGYNGSVAKRTMAINGNDPEIAIQLDASPLGDDSFGSNPLGGATLTPISTLPGSQSTFLRFYQDDTITQDDFLESFAEYSMTTKDAQFAIVAHGNNAWDAGTSLNKKMK